MVRCTPWNGSGMHGSFGNLLVIMALIFLSTGRLKAQVPECSTIQNPANGQTNVSLSAQLQWTQVPNATGYALFLGSSPGSWDIVDGADLGNRISYTPPSGWEPNSTYYFMILPRNNVGSPISCPEQSFTTGAAGGVPGCAVLQSPVDGAYGVPPAEAISWFPRNEATGYVLSIGTSSGNYDLLNNEDVGNVSSYTLPGGLPLSQQIYVKIIPYNADGMSPQCSEDTFQTRNNSPPGCTETIDPKDGDQFVPVNANITWIRDFNASGYRMTIEEKFIGGVRILDNEFVGTGTNFKPPNFLPNTLYYMTIVPFNDLGPAQNCPPISFTTGDAPDPPDCTTLTHPANGATGVPADTNLEWNAIPDARGYLLSVGTSVGGTEFVGSLDVGLVTTYSFSQDLPEGTRIFVRLVPYGIWGQAEDCMDFSFTTKRPPINTANLPIPQFFTPNSDGFNDIWVVESTPEIEIQQVWIFNRFGKLIKQMDANQPWDGTFNGRPMASDSYWYRIDTPEGHSLTGFFLLKR